jgi:ABC-type lipoprotein export system ATPase subunit
MYGVLLNPKGFFASLRMTLTRRLAMTLVDNLFEREISMAFLCLENIQKSYGQGEGETAVLRGIDLTAAEGQTVAIVGPSGCGKSTLLNIIGLLDKPTAGKVILEGRDLTSLGESEAAVMRNQKIGFVFQMHHLLPQCSVLENVLLPTLAAKSKIAQKSSRQRAEALLERVGLKDRMTYRPGQLSAGQRQRTAIVRAMICQPVLLLADEPTGALDGDNARQIALLMLELNQQEKITLIVATHSMELAAQMERQYELREGVLRNEHQRWTVIDKSKSTMGNRE